MFTYITVITLCIFVSALIKFGGITKNSKRCINIIFSAPLFILMAFRNIKLGSDTMMYCYHFSTIANTNVLEFPIFWKAPVYYLFNKFVSLFSSNQQAIIIANALVIFICMYYSINNSCDNVGLAWTIYFTSGIYIQSFNTTRQNMAVALVLVMYVLLKKRKYKSSLFIEILAIGTHSTAILGLIIWIVEFFNLKIKTKLIIYSALCLLFTFQKFAIQIFYKIFNQYYYYTSSSYIEESWGISNGNRVWTAIAIIIILILINELFKIDKKLDNEKLYEYRSLLLIIGVSFYSMIFLRHNNMMSRIEMYFSQYLIILIPNILQHIYKHSNRYIIAIIICTVLFASHIGLFMEFDPYISCFQ